MLLVIYRSKGRYYIGRLKKSNKKKNLFYEYLQWKNNWFPIIFIFKYLLRNIPPPPLFTDNFSLCFQFDADFIRVSVPKVEVNTFKEFKTFVEKLHHLEQIAFHLAYIATDGDLLPINNDSNLGKALLNSFLRIIVQRKGKLSLESSIIFILLKMYNNLVMTIFNFLTIILLRHFKRQSNKHWITIITVTLISLLLSLRTLLK